MIKKSFISLLVISSTFIFFSCGKAHEHEYVYFSDANNHWQMCCGCGEKLDKEKHSWDDGIVTKEATVEEEGVKTFTCTVCDYESNECIDKVEEKTSTDETTSEQTEASDGKDGNDGTDGKDGINGSDGKDGSDGKNGKDGKDGKDGLSINWLGSYDAASKIKSPKKLDVYYNTTDGCSYIYDGTQWTLLASKGKNGTPGGDGSDGVSIIWRGSFASSSEVTNPEKLNAYYNTTDGCSYIYNGTQWTLLASKGENGTSGGNGTNGVSITWRGSFTSASAITEPSTLDAYYNTTDGCSYIYDGSSWTLLASKGDQGPSGNDAGLQLYSITYELDGGTLGSDNPANYIGGINTPLGKATKEGYAFVGWYTNSSLKGRPVKSLGANNNENVTLYARWYDGIVTSVAGVESILETSDTSVKILITDENPHLDSISKAMSNHSTVMVNLDLSICEIKNIKNELFKYNVSLKTIILPDTVLIIGNYAFFECKNLSTITMGNSVTEIGAQAFKSCTGLSSVIIPDSVTTIGSYAFSGCTSLTHVTLGNSVTTISNNAFSNTGFTNITIPDSVTTIQSNAFQNSQLSSITIPDSVITLGDYIFKESTSLTNVVIGNSVKSIGTEAFYGCPNLKSVELGSSIKSIGSQAFANSSLTTIVIPDSVSSIGSNSFYCCDSLKNVIIGSSVTSIKDRTFWQCKQLTTVTLGSSVTTIGNDVFSYCLELTSIIIPSSLKTVGEYSFYGCNKLNTVNYTGSQEQWNQISIGQYNGYLNSATKVYNYEVE